jgi:hypothetical protein
MYKQCVYILHRVIIPITSPQSRKWDSCLASKAIIEIKEGEEGEKRALEAMRRKLNRATMRSFHENCQAYFGIGPIRMA